MRTRIIPTAIAGWLLALGGLSADDPRAPGAGGELPPPFVTRQAALVIPFTVTAGEGPDGQPAEVQVHVSTDQGATWVPYTKHRPEEGKFTFRAKQDGEFWFATKTVDRRGRVHPEGPATPQLRVVIDTRPPTLDLKVGVGVRGELTLTWSAGDERLDASSLKIEYQTPATGGTQPWQPISAHVQNGPSSQSTLQGQASWWPQTTSKLLNLRAEIRDSAQNVAVVTRQVYLPRVAQRAPAAPAFDPPPAFAPPGGAGQAPVDPLRSTPPTGGPPSQPPPQSFTGSSSQPPAADSPTAGSPAAGAPAAGGASGGSQSTVARWPEDNRLPSSQGTDLAGDSPPAGTGDMPSSDYRPEPPTPRSPDRLATFGGSDGGYSSSPETLPPPAAGEETPYRTAPPVDSRPAVPIPADSPPVADPPYGSPSVSPRASDYPADPPAEVGQAERPRLTSSRRFSLEYDVDAVGPDGVADVELWGTSDGGRTWLRWGADPDKVSPFDVEVNGEAVYGFRIVIIAKNGLAGKPPQAGDPADIWIGVDATRPNARLTAAEYGAGDRAGQLDIRWEASDAHLGPRPVTLLFSERPDGPFATIAAGLPNSGQYSWPFDPRTPRQIYLRLEVRDEAGNTAAHQLAEPINIEGLTPRGRIRGIAPAESPRQGAFRSPLFR